MADDDVTAAADDRFSVLIDLESSREVETSSGGVSWRMGPPIESGESAEAIHAAERSARYYPLHPRLFHSTKFPHDWLVPSLASALADGSDGALRSVLRAEVPGLVFSFEMVTGEFCALLLEELAHYEASGLPVRRPNTMNSYGLVVNQIGLKPLLDDLQRSILLPLSRLLFPHEGSRFDHHHSFMVKYRRGEDTHLDMHHDDSEVTLNVCLGKSFTGATLSFCGGVGESGHRRHAHKYEHALGRAVVHKGSHRHGADELTDGERVSLIMWAKCSEHRASAAYLASHVGWRRTHPGVAPEATAAEVEEESTPDPICLSETHDPDYGEHAPFRDGVTYRPIERRAHLASFESLGASARALTLKARGTDDFKASRWAAAAAKYAAAAEYVVRSVDAARQEQEGEGARQEQEGEGARIEGMDGADGPACPLAARVVSEAEAERASAALQALAPLWLNEAICHLNLHQYDAASRCCSKVIALEGEEQLNDAQHAKARFRRGLAQMGGGDHDGARADLLTAGRLEPANKAVRAKLVECTEQAKAHREHEREVYRRALGGAKGREAAAAAAAVWGE